MEGTPSDTLSQKELLALVAELRRQLAARDQQIAELQAEIAELRGYPEMTSEALYLAVGPSPRPSP